MKKIFTGILCAFLFSVMAVAQQTHTMQIKMKSGETVEYKTNEVENITFAEEAPEPEEFTVTFNTDELTSSSVKVTVTPSNSTRYYASIWIKSVMINPEGGWMSDENIIKSCSPDPIFDEKCYTGKQTISGTNFKPGAELVLIVFDASARMGGTAKVFKHEIDIPTGEGMEDQFVISNKEIGFTDVSFHAKANDPNGFLIARVVKTSDFEKYGETVVQNLYFGMQNTAVEKQMTLSEFVKLNGAYGERDFKFDELLPNTNYTAAVFYVNPDNEDPVNVYDWNYTRWDFTTKEATTAPTLEVTNLKKTVNGNGTVNISFHAKTTNAATVYCAPKSAADTEPYLDEDWEKWSDMFISWRALSSSQVDDMNSAEGTDLVFEGLDNLDYYLLVRAKNSEGGTKTLAIKVE